jgi:hypothetical protein
MISMRARRGARERKTMVSYQLLLALGVRGAAMSAGWRRARRGWLAASRPNVAPGPVVSLG